MTLPSLLPFKRGTSLSLSSCDPIRRRARCKPWPMRLARCNIGGDSLSQSICARVVAGQWVSRGLCPLARLSLPGATRLWPYLKNKLPRVLRGRTWPTRGCQPADPRRSPAYRQQVRQAAGVTGASPRNMSPLAIPRNGAIPAAECPYSRFLACAASTPASLAPIAYPASCDARIAALPA